MRDTDTDIEVAEVKREVAKVKTQMVHALDMICRNSWVLVMPSMETTA